MTHWQDSAACQSEVPTFDAAADKIPGMVEAAKRVCRRCPVVEECLEANLDERWGVVGHTSPNVRSRIRNTRRARAA